MKIKKQLSLKINNRVLWRKNGSMETIIETYVIILSKLTKCHEVDFDECEFGEYSKKLGEYFKSGKSKKRDFLQKNL